MLLCAFLHVLSKKILYTQRICLSYSSVFGPISVLHEIDKQGAVPQVMCCRMSMECLAATGEIVAGF